MTLLRTPGRALLTVFSGALAGLANGRTLRAQDAEDAQWQRECLNRPADESAVRYCDVRVQSLDAIAGHLAVDGGENGSIAVVASQSDSVIVHELVEAQAPSDSEARRLIDQIHVPATADTIRAAGPAPSDREPWTVSYRIAVPERFDLALTSINGSLSITGVTGRLRLRAVDGAIALDSVGGDVQARAQNGRLHIVLGGTRWEGTGLDAETRNGAADLAIPLPYAAHLETSTANGRLQVDVPIPLPVRFLAPGFAVDLDGGGPTVRVATMNGSLVVRPE